MSTDRERELLHHVLEILDGQSLTLDSILRRLDDAREHDVEASLEELLNQGLVARSHTMTNPPRTLFRRI